MENVIRVRACLVLKQDARILLVPHYRTDVGDVQWVIPGGSIEFGESLHQAAVREFWEETGLVTEVTELLDVSEVILPERPYHSITVTYAGRYIEGELRPEVNHPFGDKTPQWFTTEELTAVHYHPKKVIDKVMHIASTQVH